MRLQSDQNARAWCYHRPFAGAGRATELAVCNTLESMDGAPCARHRRGTPTPYEELILQGGESEGNTTQSSSDAPSMPSSFVNVAEQRTMARPMAPIQSSFSFSVSAHIK